MAAGRGRPRSSKSLPTVRSRRLGSELRRLRESAHLTQEDIAVAIGCTVSKVSRIETGHRGLTQVDLRRMLTEYGIDEDGDHAQLLVQLSRDANQRDWWDGYTDVVSPDFSTYLSLEDSAAELRSYEPLAVPGLLQTADYARALISANRVGNSKFELDRLVDIRLKRQAILTRAARPVHIWLILDEAVLRRQIGGAATMRAQMNHLADMAKLPTITLQILPFIAGAYPGMVTPFVLVGFSERSDADVVWLENMISNLYVENTEAVQRYTLIFNYMRAHAIDPDASLAMVDNAAKEH